MGNQNGIYQDISVSDIEGSHSQDSSDKKERNRGGYATDAKPPPPRRKRGNRKYVSQHPIASSSTTPILKPVETKQKQINWWKRFNHDSIRRDSYDFLFLTKNSKLVQELSTDFSDMMEMLITNIKQVEEIDPEERINSIEPNILKMLEEINSFYIDDVSKLTYKQASKIQKTISYRFISQLLHKSLENEIIDSTRRFNVMEFISFYYDFFNTSFAIFIKCNSGDAEGFSHPIFELLFKSNRYQKQSRSRMDGMEKMTAGLIIEMCNNLKKKYTFDHENESFSIEMIFPPHLFNESKKSPYKSAEEEKNALIMTNMLHMLGAPITEVEKFGMKMLRIDKNIESVFGDNAYKNINDVLLFNIECISDFLNDGNMIWSEIVSKWNSIYSAVTTHSLDNSLVISRDKFESPSYLHTDLIEFGYRIGSEMPYSQWLHQFYVSSSVKLDEIYYSKPNDNELIKKHTINYVTDLMASTLYVLKMPFIDSRQYRKLPQHMALISYMLSKSYISSFIAMSGMLKFSAKKNDKKDFNVMLYREIRPSILSLLSLNFRFFPIFDIMITLAHGEEGMRNMKCHLNFEYMSSLFSINNIKYDINEKKVVINFPITSKQLKQTIIQNGKTATHTKRLPSKQESLFIPFNWRDEDNVPTYVREKIQKDYRKSGEFTINNLKIASFTNNDVMKNACVIVSSSPVEKMCVTYSSLKDNRMASSTSVMSIIQGTSVVFNDVIKQEISAEAKEFIINNVNSSDVLKNENIASIHKCNPVKAKIKLNNFSTFIQKETQIECIQSFNIALVIDTKTIQNVIEQWMSLYFHWPIATSKAMMYHSFPDSFF
jgi:hypothetical protein